MNATKITLNYGVGFSLFSQHFIGTFEYHMAWESHWINMQFLENKIQALLDYTISIFDDMMQWFFFPTMEILNTHIAWILDPLQKWEPKFTILQLSERYYTRNCTFWDMEKDNLYLFEFFIQCSSIFCKILNPSFLIYFMLNFQNQICFSNANVEIGYGSLTE